MPVCALNIFIRRPWGHWHSLYFPLVASSETLRGYRTQKVFTVWRKIGPRVNNDAIDGTALEIGLSNIPTLGRHFKWWAGKDRHNSQHGARSFALQFLNNQFGRVLPNRVCRYRRLTQSQQKLFAAAVSV